jgi:hypothetical protein
VEEGGAGEEDEDEVDNQEKAGNGEVCGDTAEKVNGHEDTTGQGGDEDGKIVKEGMETDSTTEGNEGLATTARDDDEETGMIDTLLTVLVRLVLASVWIAVILGWVLERISDVLALLIELGLAWMQPPHRDLRMG